MRLALLALLLATMILLMLFGSGESVVGLEPSIFASLVSLGVILFLVVGGRGRVWVGRGREALQAALAWVAIFFVAIALYAYRFDLADVANRVLAEVAPGTVIQARGGEVSVARDRSGSFVLNGEANGVAARFLFDTGASSVVLTDATARAVGIDPARLSFNVPVRTANGVTTTAPVLLDSLRIGSIREARVPALVARPGQLGENLLGMSFLGRLGSYEVRNERLTLRAAGRRGS